MPLDAIAEAEDEGTVQVPYWDDKRGRWFVLDVPLGTGLTRGLAAQLDDGNCIMLNRLSMQQRSLFAHVYHTPTDGRGPGLRKAHFQHAVLQFLDILDWATLPDEEYDRLECVACTGARLRLQTFDRYTADTRRCDRGH